MNNDTAFSKIIGLINYAVRVRSIHYKKNSDKYLLALQELQSTLEELKEPQRSPKHDKSTVKSGAVSRREEIKELLKEKLKLDLPLTDEEVKAESKDENENSNQTEEARKIDGEKVEEILKRYEKTFGKSKLQEKLKSARSDKIDTPIPKPPKRREVIQQIKALELQEEDIHLKKQELNKVLELKSRSSSTTSRQVTVRSVASHSNKNPLISRRKPSHEVKNVPEIPRLPTKDLGKNGKNTQKESELSFDAVAELIKKL